MDKKDIYLGLLISEDMPQQVINKFESELNAINIELKTARFPSRTIYNCLEWAIPTVVGLYIIRPYFEGFLKELSKDHYNYLKKWIKKTAIDLRLIKVHTITAKSSTSKINPQNTQSRVFSISAISNTGEHLKFLFDDTLSNEDWEKGIELLLELLEEHYCSGDNDRLSLEIKKNNSEREIYCCLKTDKIDWEISNYKKKIIEEIVDSGNNIQ